MNLSHLSFHNTVCVLVGNFKVENLYELSSAFPHTRWILRLGHSTSKFGVVIALLPRMKRVSKRGRLMSILRHITFVNVIFSKDS